MMFEAVALVTSEEPPDASIREPSFGDLTTTVLKNLLG